MSQREDVTLLLNSIAEGGPAALDRLLPLAYDELGLLAQRYCSVSFVLMGRCATALSSAYPNVDAASALMTNCKAAGPFDS